MPSGTIKFFLEEQGFGFITPDDDDDDDVYFERRRTGPAEDDTAFFMEGDAVSYEIDENMRRPVDFASGPVATSCAVTRPATTTTSCAAAASNDNGHTSGNLTMQILVKLPDDHWALVLDVKASDTIDNVKKKIHERVLDTPPDQQRLFFCGQQLENGRTLSSYNINKDKSLQLEFRGRSRSPRRGGGPSSAAAAAAPPGQDVDAAKEMHVEVRGRVDDGSQVVELPGSATLDDLGDALRTSAQPPRFQWHWVDVPSRQAWESDMRVDALPAPACGAVPRVWLFDHDHDSESEDMPF